MSRVLPVVVNLAAAEAGETEPMAYLLRWEQHADGWYAVLLWVEQGEGDGPVSHEKVVVPAGLVRQVPGQDYKRVPRVALSGNG